MVGTTGLYDRMPKAPDRLPLGEFTSASQHAWTETFNFFLHAIENGCCENVSFQQNLERQAEHFFKMLKKETLRFVNMERRNPCGCCPSVRYEIVELDAFGARTFESQ